MQIREDPVELDSELILEISGSHGGEYVDLVFWVVTSSELVGRFNILEKHIVSIFRAKD
jgi:hypothetical protein